MLHLKNEKKNVMPFLFFTFIPDTFDCSNELFKNKILILNLFLKFISIFVKFYNFKVHSNICEVVPLFSYPFTFVKLFLPIIVKFVPHICNVCLFNC